MKARFLGTVWSPNGEQAPRRQTSERQTRTDRAGEPRELFTNAEFSKTVKVAQNPVRQ
jgi:hypothetical protein